MTKNRLPGFARTFALLTLALSGAQAAPAPATRPNIIVILADDMGFSDIGCYGSEIPTPNLDQLAAEGLRFTEFYNNARCCPSRASLMTGLYSHEAGIGHMDENGNEPGYLGHLNDQCVTLGEAMRGAGYFTALAGKWHLGTKSGVVPFNRGFDASLSSPAGGFYYPEVAKADLWLNGADVGKGGVGGVPTKWYTTDLYTDYGIQFIDQAKAAGKPFLLYLAYNAPHYPLQAPADEVAKFRGKYKIGWDELRKTRLARQIELGVLDKNTELSPRPAQVKAWDSLTPAEQDRFDNIMAVYAAVIAHMDMDIGRLVAALKERKAFDNTLILFMSDNGANAESGPNGKLNGQNPGSAHSVVFEGQSWATLSNTPMRRYKHFDHEGGIATPLIAHWPAGIKAKGEFRSQFAQIVDVMATCMDVSHGTYPKVYNGHEILPMEGASLFPAFANQPLQRTREGFFWEHEGNAAARIGDWKLVRVGKRGAWELYDLKNDRTELHDLAAQKPDMVKDLSAKWDAWSVRVHVVPYPEKKGQKSGNEGKSDDADE